MLQVHLSGVFINRHVLYRCHTWDRHWIHLLPTISWMPDNYAVVNIKTTIYRLHPVQNFFWWNCCFSWRADLLHKAQSHTAKEWTSECSHVVGDCRALELWTQRKPLLCHDSPAPEISRSWLPVSALNAFRVCRSCCHHQQHEPKAGLTRYDCFK